MKANNNICIYKELFSEVEYSEFAGLMQEINCTEFGDTPEANKRLDELTSILDEKCQHWSGINHFVRKADIEDHPTPWILYIYDEYTGVAIDVEDLFENAFDAAQRGLELEYEELCKFCITLGNGDELRVEPAHTIDYSDNYTSYCVQYYFCKNTPSIMDEDFIQLFGSAYQAYLFCINFKDATSLTLNNNDDELKNINRQSDCTIPKRSRNFAGKISGIIRGWLCSYCKN
jgi:hypothetical protein